MKIAILISGEYRTFPECVESMPFLNDPAVDVYFSTWSTSTYNIDFLNIHETTTITPEHVSNYISSKGVTINISDVSTDKVGTISRMINRWVTGMNMIIKSGIEYDYVYIIRPDLYFIKPSMDICQCIQTYIEKHIFYISQGTPLVKEVLNDVCMLASMDVLTKVINPELESQWEIASSTGYEWHHWWYKYITDRCLIQELKMDTPLGSLLILRMPKIHETTKDEITTANENLDGWGLVAQNIEERSLQWQDIHIMDLILKESIKHNLNYSHVQLKSAFNWYIDRFEIIKNKFLKNAKLISNRGNTRAGNPLYENEPTYVNAALRRFNVKIDVWVVDNEFYLGNDNPQYKINESFLFNNRLWCQARNIEALENMKNINVPNYFWQDEDEDTLTSSGFIWASASKPFKKSLRPKIIVMPTDIHHINTTVAGVCCDYVELLYDIFNRNLL